MDFITFDLPQFLLSFPSAKNLRAIKSEIGGEAEEEEEDKLKSVKNYFIS